MKNFKYYKGEEILFQLSGSQHRIIDHIFDLSDSSVIFEVNGEVKMSDISFIYRENWLIQILRGLSLLGGTAYFGVDSFNRLINREGPVIQAETLLISSGMVAFSFALVPLRYRKINTSEKWLLKYIDPDSL